MKISIVIPAYNEEKLLAGNLRAIQHAAAPFRERGWDVERIVCDNNSTDRTGDIAQREGATVVFEPANQIGRARNRGAAAATGEWLIFIDADSRPSRELMEDVALAIASGKYLAGGATIRPDEWFATFAFMVGSWNIVSRALRWSAGSFIFCQTEAFRTLGGFNTEMFVMEEIDLSRRLKALAKIRGQAVAILARHPLLTSARKMTLYDLRERAGFFLSLLRYRDGVVRDRLKCGIWYDGRR